MQVNVSAVQSVSCEIIVQQVTDRRIAQYISTLWFGEHQSVAVQSYNRQRLNPDASVDNAADKGLVRSARRGPRSTVQCSRADKRRDIRWFLDNVAVSMVAPSSTAALFGLLRVRTGRCGRLLPDTGRILLENCRPQLYGRPSNDMIFQLERDGRLTIAGRLILTSFMPCSIVIRYPVYTHDGWTV